MKPNRAENFLTEADYLAGEQDGQVRHELIDGQAYAMTGASDYHNKLSDNLFAELRNALKHKNSPCITYVNDMKLKVKQDFYYPDVMVVCGRQDTQNAYYKTRPLVIVEVLSPSTRRFDYPLGHKKTHKRLAYQALESLQEYGLSFRSIDTSIGVADIYYQVDNDDMLDFLQTKQDAAGDVV